MPASSGIAYDPDEMWCRAAREIAASQPWFQVVHLDAAGCCPMLEVGDQMAEHTEALMRSAAGVGDPHG